MKLATTTITSLHSRPAHIAALFDKRTAVMAKTSAQGENDGLPA